MPVIFSGLELAVGYGLRGGRKVVDRSGDGNEFWEADFSPVACWWSRTFAILVVADLPRCVSFTPSQ
ncbi:MAG: hypothetical protein P8J87_13730 [Verrucomicrobiales bacterium]|nr:hypothetical protein [Verrucomicrobiales bacterium]